MKPPLKWLLAGAVASGVLFFVAKSVATEAINYTPSSRYPWGASAQGGARSRPAGLPENTRRASVAGAAMPYVRKFAEACMRRWNAKLPVPLPPEYFVQTVMTLAQNESGATFGLPGLPFNLRPRRAGEEAEGATEGGSGDNDLPQVGEGSDGSGNPEKPISTAWGVFQWRQDDWNGISRPTYFKPLAAHQPSAHPWTATPHDEIYYPIERYGQIYKLVTSEGGSPAHAAYTILLYHQSPTAYDKMRTLAKSVGYHRAIAEWTRGSSEKQISYDEKARLLYQRALGLLPPRIPYPLL